MSYCKSLGKDKIIFVTKEDHETPSSVTLAPIPPEERPAGLVLPNGELNWNCPCLGGVPTGPCGLEFREAVSCMHFTTVEPKGSECVPTFRKMAECMEKYPGLYGNPTEDAMKEPSVSEASIDVSENKSTSLKVEDVNVSKT